MENNLKANVTTPFVVTEEDIKKFQMSKDAIRQTMLNNIGAVQLPENCIRDNGVIYPESLRNILPYNGSINKVMHNICMVKKVNGTYRGVCIYKGLEVKFLIDPIVDRKAYGFFTPTSRCIKYSKAHGRHAIYMSSNNRVIISSLIACFDLLLSGYYLNDWSLVGVNHKDNSAGRNTSLEENIASSNLELYLLTLGELNFEHGVLSNRLAKMGINASFSVYGGFKKYCSHLKDNNALTVENILKYPYSKKYNRYYFD